MGKGGSRAVANCEHRGRGRGRRPGRRAEEPARAGGGSRAARVHGSRMCRCLEAPGSCQPLWLWCSAGPSLSPKGGGESPARCASLAASHRPRGAQPAPGPGGHQTTPAPRAWAQPWTSDLTAAKTESERPDPHGGRGAGSRKVTGRTGALPVPPLLPLLGLG